MQEKQILKVSQGIWIDEHWLHKTGLGAQVEIEMKTGEIRIQATSKTTKKAKPSKKGWCRFSDYSSSKPAFFIGLNRSTC